MRTRSPRALLLAPVLLLGCQEPGDIASYPDLNNTVRVPTCNCPPDAGASSQEGCDDALVRIDLARRDCLAATLDGYEEGGHKYLECVNVELAAYVDCLEGNVTCDDGAIDSCTQSYTSASSACPQLPDGCDSRSGPATCSS